MKENLRTLREKAGWEGVAKVAQELGVSRATIYDLVNGRVEKVSVHRRNQVWEAMGLELEPEPVTLTPLDDGKYADPDGKIVVLRFVRSKREPVGLLWDETVAGATIKRLTAAIKNREVYHVG